MTQEPPETTPLDDDEELELGFCWGCWRLEVDEEASSELEVDEELVPDDVDEVPALDVEPDAEPFEWWNSFAAAIENAAVSTTAPVASHRLARDTRPRPRLRAAGDVSDARVMPSSLDGPA